MCKYFIKYLENKKNSKHWERIYLPIGRQVQARAYIRELINISVQHK